ncbi:hypothetical protein PD653B2_4145 [Nocardioides sp. PD653-B2]|nr:hypothetical protein PD653B2_4145 [Nocardioides sp. PD653-B2]
MVLPLLALLVAAPANADIEIIGDDTQAPVVRSLSLSPASVDVSTAKALVTLTAQITDDVSGYQGGYAYLEGPGNITYPIWVGNASRTSGTDLDGTFTGTTEIPAHAPAGTYHLTCNLGDKVGHYTNTCPSATLTVRSVDDTQAPVVRSLSLSPASVDVSTAKAIVTLTAQITDDVSGYQGGYAYLEGPGNITYPIWVGNASRTSGTDLDGTFTGTTEIPAHAPAGTYHLTCNLGDKVGRYTNTCPSATTVVEDHSVDLSTTLTASVTEAHRGDTATASVRVSNAGPATPIAPQVSIPVPSGATLVSMPPSCARSGPSAPVVCTIAATELDPGESVTRQVAFEVSPEASGTLTLSATASSSSEERTPADNTATLAIPVVVPDEPVDTGSPAKLSLSSSVDPTIALPGDTVTYTLSATNAAGAGDATGTVVTDVLPAGVTFAGASDGCANTVGTVRCDLGTVAAGTTKTATISATVDPMPMRPDPNTAHQVLEQKAETDLRVERDETRTATASCPSGYVATDGGIRLDAVDQGGSVAATSVPSSGPTADGTGWTATLANANPGAALAKVTVACLARTTVTGSHQHDLTTSTSAPTHAALTAGANTVDVSCATGQTPFAPAYALTGAGVVTTSRPSGSGWTFVVDAASAGSGVFGVSCLDARTTTTDGHFHVLGLDHRAETVTVPAGQTVETQLSCADEAKGIVASRRVDAGLVDRGTDPRAKIRAFRFTNPTDHPLSADIGLTCVDIRTSGEPVATRITNTATVTTTATDATPADDTATATFTAYGEGWATLPDGVAAVSSSGSTVAVALRCASACTVSARMVALGRVAHTSIRAGSTLATGRVSVAASTPRSVHLRATAAARASLRTGKVLRARLVVTTTDGATFSRVMRLRP